MSTSPSCATCKGTGFVCSNCGRSNRRPESKDRRDFGRGCYCRGAKTKRCPTHVEVVLRCDGCGVVITSWAFLRHAPVDASSAMACSSCQESWAQWLSVAFEQWQATRTTRT